MKTVRLYLTLFFIGITAGSAVDLDSVRDLAAEGKTAAALAELERRMKRDEILPRDVLMQGTLLAELGRIEEAERVFLDLSEDHPDLPEPYNNLAVLYSDAGEYEKAIEVLKQALGTDASYRTAYENLTVLYGHLAGEAYQKALGLDQSGTDQAEELTLLSEVSQPSTGAAQVVAEPVAAAALEPVEVATEPTVQPVPVDPMDLVEETVRAWAQAWSAQDANRYLSFYSSDFEPTDGMGRQEWESLRRTRLETPSFVQVEIGAIEVLESGEGRASVRFDQEYRSDNFQDRVTKYLELVWRNGAWKIFGERSEG